ncbi:hypothetical protein H2198_007239 [Neophaeococcomyces mojaviensis]|uniref:Uncharacterized protein n=1 Tax=Neophaeococcomyces mojaviensis TaxID=3383035 RepID=A0ACC3A0J1_9EURO|nr:hypothetical protein H2198_007239 [Knufia sp. JES_112]
MVGFDNLIPETHGTLFHSAQTVTVTGKVTPREVIVETYQNTSRAEYVFRVVQSVCTLLVFIITIANYVSTQDDPEVNKSWWNYVLILCGSTIPFLIYVSFVEGYVLLHVGAWRQFMIILSITAEAVAAFFWFFGFIGLILMSAFNIGEHTNVSNANGFATFCGFVNWLSFWNLAYAYWHALRHPPPVVTRTEYDVEIAAEVKSTAVVSVSNASNDQVSSVDVPAPAYSRN